MKALRQRRQPLRDPGFMEFIHEQLLGTPCCVCGERPWRQLHHFGDDGGKALKPSDHLVARVCRQCVPRTEIKARALLRAWWHRGDGDSVELLLKFYADAADSWRAHAEYQQAARSRGKGTTLCRRRQ